jgi:hypothetical protein
MSMNMTRKMTVLASLTFVLVVKQANSADNQKVAAADPQTAKFDAKSPLAGLPSVPGAHIDKIKALGDNQWLHLGAPAPDPKWGKASGRSWCPHMPYAPELKAAFYAGGGRHEFIKPNGLDESDLWAYDVQAHRWMCLFPGADPKALTLKLDANGFEVDADGQPVPLAQLCHAYEQDVYDTDRRKFMFMPTIVTNAWTERRKLWDGKFGPGGGNVSPWMYNVAAGKFELLKVKGAVPDYTYSNIAEYIPSLKKMVYLQSKGIAWLYDPQANTWTNLKPTGPKPPFGIDASACLDFKRDRIYFGGGYYDVAPAGTNAFWCYDIKTNSYMDLQPKGKPCGGSNRYGPDTTIMNYDSANDAVVLFNHHWGEDTPPGNRGIFVYDPAANSWSDLPLPKDIRNHCSSFYCAELNAHFIHTANDSTDDGTMWVYRYKQAKK